jgi:hypothetical protein
MNLISIKMLNLLPFQSSSHAVLLLQTSGNTTSQSITTANLVVMVATLVFGLAVLSMQGRLFVKKNQGIGSQYIRLFGLTLIMVFAVFLVTTGYSQEQVSPAFTLLGTIAGYLLKSGESKESGEFKE